MKYIWINPVTESMYESHELNSFLHRHGYECVNASGDWLNIVKEKYKAAVCQAKRTVIDMRCPKVREVLEEYPMHSEVLIPDIHPILIHCAKELAEREDLRGTEKIITTPCQALADLGNSLSLIETSFIAWNRFVESTGDSLNGKQQKESPIPPGFFEGTVENVISVTGEKEIRKYFKNYKPDETQVVEMLFCRNGCHNGDGVRMCKS